LFSHFVSDLVSQPKAEAVMAAGEAFWRLAIMRLAFGAAGG